MTSQWVFRLMQNFYQPEQAFLHHSNKLIMTFKYESTLSTIAFVYYMWYDVTINIWSRRHFFRLLPTLSLSIILQPVFWKLDILINWDDDLNLVYDLNLAVCVMCKAVSGVFLFLDFVNCYEKDIDYLIWLIVWPVNFSTWARFRPSTWIELYYMWQFDIEGFIIALWADLFKILIECLGFTQACDI